MATPRINVLSPDGQEGTIPQSQVQQAGVKGYRAVMYDKSGQRGSVPFEQMPQATRSGYTTTPPTPFEKERQPENRRGFLSTVGGDLLSQAEGVGEDIIKPATTAYEGYKAGGLKGAAENLAYQYSGLPTTLGMTSGYRREAQSGRSLPYRGTAFVGRATGIAPVDQMEQAADVGNARAVLGHAALPAAEALAAPAWDLASTKLGEVRSRVGESIRTPEGKLKTIPKATAQVAGGVGGAALGAPLGHEYVGAAAGYKLGPTLLESFFPDPNAELRARGAFMNKGYRPAVESASPELSRQRELGEFMNRGYKPTELPAGPETVPFKPFKPSESVARQMRSYGTYDPFAESRPSSVTSRVGGGPLGKTRLGETSGQAGATGSAEGPFAPLVWESPEEAAAHDLRMKNLGRQAHDAGVYSAAQGATKRKLNYQQRIGRKELQ